MNPPAAIRNWGKEKDDKINISKNVFIGIEKDFI